MTKKPTTQVLKQLLVDNNIAIPAATKGKTELFLMLFDAGVLKREEVFPPRKEKVERQPKMIDPKHEYLRTIRTHPKKVTFTDIETGEVTTYDSIYKAVKATGYAGRYMQKHNGEVVCLRKVNRKYRVVVE